MAPAQEYCQGSSVRDSGPAWAPEPMRSPSHYGMPVPGVYVAPSWRTASQYPIMPTTGNVPAPGQNKQSQLSGGTLIAGDGTPPLRVVVQMMAEPTKRLWPKVPIRPCFGPPISSSLTSSCTLSNRRIATKCICIAQ